MACVPVKHPGVEIQKLESGDLMLIYPLKTRPWIARLARKLGLEDRPRYKKLQLDELGTAVWESIDGQQPVSAIVRGFARRYQLHPKEAELSVTRFLRELGRRGLVAMKSGCNFKADRIKE